MKNKLFLSFWLLFLSVALLNTCSGSFTSDEEENWLVPNFNEKILVEMIRDALSYQSAGMLLEAELVYQMADTLLPIQTKLDSCSEEGRALVKKSGGDSSAVCNYQASMTWTTNCNDSLKVESYTTVSAEEKAVEGTTFQSTHHYSTWTLEKDPTEDDQFLVTLVFHRHGLFGHEIGQRYALAFTSSFILGADKHPAGTSSIFCHVYEYISIFGWSPGPKTITKHNGVMEFRQDGQIHLSMEKGEYTFEW